MKKVLALLVFVLIPLAPLRAQGLHGKILIYHQDQDPEINTLLASFYNGQVDSPARLPTDLSSYDAILLCGSGGYGDTLSTEDELNLITYLNNHGSLYASSGRSRIFGLQGTLLWHFMGLKGEGLDAVFDYYDTIYGIDSEFTIGLRLPQTVVTAYQAETYFPHGEILPVLVGREFGSDLFDWLAWIPSNRMLRAVMYHPLTGGTYYKVFLRRVLCNYFGLCAPDGVKSPQPTDASSIQIELLNGRTSLRYATDESANVDVMNSLGITVFTSTIGQSMPEIELPGTLPDGVYFARVRMATGMQVKAFAIVQK